MSKWGEYSQGSSVSFVYQDKQLRVRLRPDRIESMQCPEGENFDWCDPTTDLVAVDNSVQLLRLCPAGEGNPSDCLRREQFVQGFHDLIFGTSDKDGSRSV